MAKLALAALILLTTISLHLEVVHVPLALALPRLAGHHAAPCASPAAPAPPAAELGRLTRSKRCACKGCAAHAALAYPLPEYFPLAPLPLMGLISAVGIPSIKRVSAPSMLHSCFIPPIIISKVPLVRSILMAMSIPTR